ncbi:MAG: ATP-binding cassette domain-containing protein [Candidatus Dormibacteraeota bacterium]|nr:ATP-binding cassette domain-containing protein [Candidatus Dormibacteraeota bacterium]
MLYTASDTEPRQEVAAPGSVRLEAMSAGYGGEVVLADFSLSVDPGEFVFVAGPSGAGKSTLIKVIHGALLPQAVVAQVDGVDLTQLRPRDVPALRRRIGCVFQGYELLPHLTALENVLVPLELAQVDVSRPAETALEALDSVGLSPKQSSLPHELSGGQQQRVAIARAIAHQPRILLADEPTGNLDSRATADVMEAFDMFNASGGTVIMATHDDELRARYDRRVINVEPRRAA